MGIISLQRTSRPSSMTYCKTRITNYTGADVPSNSGATQRVYLNSLRNLEIFLNILNKHRLLPTVRWTKRIFHVKRALSEFKETYFYRG